MIPLEPPDSIHLKAAEGWLGLGDFQSANDELEEISPESKAHPAVLIMRFEIYAKAKKWEMASEIAHTLTLLLPENPGVWINLAYSTRRKTGGDISQAKGILVDAEPKFPREYLFPFNLACYCSQLNQFEEAEKWLKKAMAIDSSVKTKAIDDPDLKPLWDSMSGTLWKKNRCTRKEFRG